MGHRSSPTLWRFERWSGLKVAQLQTNSAYEIGVIRRIELVFKSTFIRGRHTVRHYDTNNTINWLPLMESNHRSQVQSLYCYHYKSRGNTTKTKLVGCIGIEPISKECHSSILPLN